MIISCFFLNLELSKSNLFLQSLCEVEDLSVYGLQFEELKWEDLPYWKISVYDFCSAFSLRSYIGQS